MNYQTRIRVGRRSVTTLADIVPERGPMKMLIIGKTPVPDPSVRVGHYFQGRQGRMLCRKLKAHALLQVPDGCYEDEVLLDHGYGVTDVIKVPHPFGDEPSDDEYRAGAERLPCRNWLR